MIKKIAVVLAAAAVVLLTGAADCDNSDCPTPKNKGVCINKYWEDK